MHKFTVTWNETVAQSTEVEAATEDQAIEQVMRGEYDEVTTENFEYDVDSFSAKQK